MLYRHTHQQLCAVRSPHVAHRHTNAVLNPVSGMTTTPEPPECSLSMNQRREETMDCPLTNQGPCIFTYKIGAKRV